HGASVALAQRIHKRYGASAVHVVSHDPYRLAIDVWGIGFLTADRIAGELGIARDSPERMQAGVLGVLRGGADARHTDAARGDVVARAAKLLELAPRATGGRIDVAAERLVAAGHVIAEKVHDTHILFPASLHAAEARLAARIAELARPTLPALEGAGEAIRA